jgi:5-methyltetrahydrofolate--homocysteine methyltransferase
MHAQARKDWGYGERENLSVPDLVAEKYRGIRPAFGYPACPDHTEKFKLFEILGAPEQGITLTEHAAMLPAASVSGLYFSHPEAKYFMVGRIGRDQAESYAARKGMPLQEVERWLGPNLAYEPAALTTAKRLRLKAQGSRLKVRRLSRLRLRPGRSPPKPEPKARSHSCPSGVQPICTYLI